MVVSATCLAQCHAQKGKESYLILLSAAVLRQDAKAGVSVRHQVRQTCSFKVRPRHCTQTVTGESWQQVAQLPLLLPTSERERV